MISELEKWDLVHAVAVDLEAFIEFLVSKKKYSICKQIDDRFMPCGELSLELIYEYFDIDAKKLEKERRELLEGVKNRS